MSIYGKWSYRSLLNNPDLAVEFNMLRFGMGTLDLIEAAPEDAGGNIGGTIGGPGWSLNLSGSYDVDFLTRFTFQGRGVLGGEEWVYDYAGILVPDWPHGVDQVPALVGSVIRTEQHGTAPAGLVASWYAVRQP